MSLTPDALGERIDALGANGHSWMDGPTLLSLAAAPSTDTEMLQQAQALTSAAQTQTVATPLSSYSALDAANYSPQDQLTQTVHSVVGAPRLSLNDLTSVQEGLIKGGYGKGLATDGVWNPDWQAAYSQFSSDAKARYFQGEQQVATQRTKDALNHIMNAFTASGGLGSLWGFVSSIPHDLRQVVGDTIGATEGLGSYVGREAQGLVTGTAYSARGQSSIFGSAEHDALTGSGFVEGRTAQEQHRRFTDANGNWDWGKVTGTFVDNLGTALLVAGPIAKGVVSSIEVGGALGREAADTSIKDVLTRTLTRSAPENAVRAPGYLYRTLVADGGKTGLLNREAVANIPVLGRVGPALAKVGPDYYRLRTMLATPYAIPAVQGAGTLLGRSILAGAEARGVGALSGVVGGDPNDTLNAAVTHNLDPYTMHLGFLKPLGLDSAVNDLGFLLHPALPGGSAETLGQTVSKQVGGATEAVGKVMGGPLSPLGAYQRAVELSTGTRTSLGSETEKFGNQANLFQFVQAKADQHAAAMLAEKRMVESPDAPQSVTTAEGQHWVHEQAGKILSDPVDMAEARTLFAADRHEMIGRFHREMVTSGMDLEHAKGNGGQVYVETLRALSGLLASPEDRAALITPEAFAARDRELAAAPAPFDPAAPAPGKPLLTADFLRQQNINQDRGSIGLARQTTWTTQRMSAWMKQAQREFSDFQQRSAERPNLASQIDDQARTWLHGKIIELTKQTGTDFTQMSRLLSTTEPEAGFAQLMQVAADRQNLLASEVFPAMGAPQRVRDVFEHAKANGYKVVYGNGIGHAAEAPVLPQDLGEALTRSQRLFGALGLSVARTRQSTVADMRAALAEQEAQRLIDSGRLTSVSSDLVNGRNLIGILRHAFNETPEPAQDFTTAQKIAQGIGTLPTRRAATAQLAAAGKTRDVPTFLAAHGVGSGTKQIASVADMRQAIDDMHSAQVQMLGLRELRRTNAVNALTDPQRYPWLLTHLELPDGSIAGTLSREDAGRLYDTILSAYGKVPTYMLGWQHGEDLFRSGMGMLGATWPTKLPAPLQSMVLGMARLPNRYYQSMSRLRFQLSPMFDLRRVAKTNLKFATYGIRPVVDPAHALLAEGGPKAFNDAHALLDKVWPEQALANRQWLDSGDQMLAANSVYGLFNPRHFAAWAVHDMAAQGKSITQMRDTLDKALTYGNRTALERSLNTVFFPFSFDKTLYRAVGGYVLDHYAQSIIMLRAFAAYDQFAQQHDTNPASYKWWQEHAPVLNEAARLNAFTHGIGPGEVGGINAPLLNAFLPQKYPPSPGSNDLIKRLIPALSDMQRVMKEAQQTGHDTWDGIQTGLYKTEIALGQRKATPLNAPPSAVAGSYALSDALQFKRQLSDALQTTLAYNSTHDTKYTWPTTDQVPSAVRGQPIDSTTINLIVQHRFPSFNPIKAVEIAEQRRTQFTTVLGQHADDPTWSGIASFAKQVNSLAVHVRDENRSPAALAAAAQKLRDYAVQVGRTDPDFQKAYGSFFEHVLGPITWSAS